MNPYATHQKLLRRAIELSTGPILEIGAGEGSTAFIHILAPERKIVTLETDAEWIERFTYMRNNFHAFVTGSDYEEFDVIVRQYWDVVLIDHHPGGRRNFEIRKVVNCRFVIIHDTDYLGNEYEKTLPLYKYHFRDESVIPFTTVVSNIDDLSGFYDL